MNLKSSIVCALLAAAGGTAPAGVFSWTGGDGFWNDHTNWAGPIGQVPSLTVDSATVSGNLSDATLQSNISLGLLNILNGGGVWTAGHSIFVNGDVNVLGDSSDLSVSNSPALRDLDADTIRIDRGIIGVYDGVMQADEAIEIIGVGGIIGTGVVEMNSTTGHLNLSNGFLWAFPDASSTDTLTVRRTGTSTSRLLWSSPDAILTTWSGGTLDIQIPVSGSLGGTIDINTGSTVRIADPFVAAPSSLIDLFGGQWAADEQAVLEAPVVDSYGAVEVDGEGVIRSPFVALRGSADFGPDCYFYLESAAVILDSFAVTSPGGTGGNFHFVGVQTLNVTGGVTSVSTGQFGLFDLDGSGDMTTNIADGSSLILDVHHIQSFQTDSFSGTINNAGSLHIESYLGGSLWSNYGEIYLDQGEISGRRLGNYSLLSGSGSIDAPFVNGGELVADGGTLFINEVVDGELRGVIRAETGDLILGTGGGPTDYRLYGQMFVGNGQAIPEVVETNKWFRVENSDQGVGSMSLNGGYVRAGTLMLGGTLQTQGNSMLRASGNHWSDQGVVFRSTGTSTVSGTLEIDGWGKIRAGHAFTGEGTIHAISPARGIDLDQGANLGDVSLTANGLVSVGDEPGGLFPESGIGQATVGGFTLAPTATLRIDVGGPNQGTDHDSIAALDAATIDGTLVLGTVNGYVPPIGQTVTIIDAASVQGSFDAVDDSALAPTRRAVVTVEPDRVLVMYTCIADLNGDGVLDLADVNAFVNAFTSNDPAADIAMPYGVLDLSDVNTFANMFNSGCN